MYTPVFHPFLILREREKCSQFCFSSYFKRQLSLSVFFNGKDKPRVDLDQMRFAHVRSLRSAAGPPRAGSLLPPQPQTLAVATCPTWPSPPRPCVSQTGGLCILRPPSRPSEVPADPPKAGDGGAAAGGGDHAAAALALRARPLGGPGPWAYTPTTLSLCLSLSLRVQAQRLGEARRWGPSPAPQVSVPHPGCCSGSAATPGPLVPVAACPAPSQPMPPTARNLAAISAPGPAQTARGWTGGRVVGRCPPPPPAVSSEPSHGFRYPPPASALPGVGAAWGRGGGWGQRAAPRASQHWPVSEARPLCPPASYLTGVVFRDSLRPQIKILPVEKLTKSFHAVHGSLSLFYF